MSMMFDRMAPYGGVETECIPENGKVLLTWKFRFVGEVAEALILVTVKDREGNMVLECRRREPEEEPLQAILLHPRLWQGTENPYLYQMEVNLWDRQGKLLDRVVRPLPLRRLEKRPEKGYFLNGALFVPRTVCYEPSGEGEKAQDHGRMLRDLDFVLQLGANSIYCGESTVKISALRFLCDKLGLLLWHEMPEISLRGGKQNLLDSATDRPLPLYYQYKARWSSQPFVYIVPESVTVGNGGFKAMVYSNCEKVVLYTDGVLFEVHSGEGEFVFDGIPARHPCIMLTAEADGCAASLSLQKSCI